MNMFSILLGIFPAVFVAMIGLNDPVIGYYPKNQVEILNKSVWKDPLPTTTEMLYRKAQEGWKIYRETSSMFILVRPVVGYEYRVILNNVGTGGDDEERFLNDVGKEGWELIDVVYAGNLAVNKRYYFKRKL